MPHTDISGILQHGVTLIIELAGARIFASGIDRTAVLQTSQNPAWTFRTVNNLFAYLRDLQNPCHFACEQKFFRRALLARGCFGAAVGLPQAHLSATYCTIIMSPSTLQTSPCLQQETKPWMNICWCNECAPQMLPMLMLRRRTRRTRQPGLWSSCARPDIIW